LNGECYRCNVGTKFLLDNDGNLTCATIDPTNPTPKPLGCLGAPLLTGGEYKCAACRDGFFLNEEEYGCHPCYNGCGTCDMTKTVTGPNCEFQYKCTSCLSGLLLADQSGCATCTDAEDVNSGLIKETLTDPPEVDQCKCVRGFYDHYQQQCLDVESSCPVVKTDLKSNFYKATYFGNTADVLHEAKCADNYPECDGAFDPKMCVTSTRSWDNFEEICVKCDSSYARIDLTGECVTCQGT
jgi:hypothetical protein